MGAPPFSFGSQFLFDQHQRYVRSGLKVYLRVKNFPEQGDYLDVGVPFAATGTQAIGYTDIRIQPPPNVQDISLHNIGILAGRLNFGSRIFTVSNTFVKDQLEELNAGSSTEITDPKAVFRERDGNQAIGLVYENRMFAIEDIVSRQVSGVTISWRLICNALDSVTDSPINDPDDQ